MDLHSLIGYGFVGRKFSTRRVSRVIPNLSFLWRRTTRCIPMHKKMYVEVRPLHNRLPLGLSRRGVAHDALGIKLTRNWSQNRSWLLCFSNVCSMNKYWSFKVRFNSLTKSETHPNNTLGMRKECILLCVCVCVCTRAHVCTFPQTPDTSVWEAYTFCGLSSSNIWWQSNSYIYKVDNVGEYNNTVRYWLTRTK